MTRFVALLLTLALGLGTAAPALAQSPTLDKINQSGTLVIGTPDYATIGWRIIEPIYGLLMPGGYRDEHITHYTRASLTEILVRNGFVHEQTAYVAKSELIMKFRKHDGLAAAAAPASTGRATSAA